jgi:hypothetical protein
VQNVAQIPRTHGDDIPNDYVLHLYESILLLISSGINQSHALPEHFFATPVLFPVPNHGPTRNHAVLLDIPHALKVHVGRHHVQFSLARFAQWIVNVTNAIPDNVLGSMTVTKHVQCMSSMFQPWEQFSSQLVIQRGAARNLGEFGTHGSRAVIQPGVGKSGRLQILPVGQTLLIGQKVGYGNHIQRPRSVHFGDIVVVIGLKCPRCSNVVLPGLPHIDAIALQKVVGDTLGYPRQCTGIGNGGKVWTPCAAFKVGPRPNIKAGTELLVKA